MPFHLHIGRLPRLIPPLTPQNISEARRDFPNDITNALEAIVALKTDVADAHDALLASRIKQANAANVHRSEEPTFEVNDLVYLSTAHRRREYLNGNNKRVGKFMPRFDGQIILTFTLLFMSPSSKDTCQTMQNCTRPGNCNALDQLSLKTAPRNGK